jgi:hypothetical protein
MMASDGQRDRALAAVLVAAAVGCSSSAAVDESPAASSASASSSSGGPGGAGGAGGALGCEVNDVPLRLDLDDDGSITVLVEHEGQDALLALDTGSALSFLYLGADGPDYIPEAGSVVLGCETLSLPGRGFAAEVAPRSGLPIVGVMGASFFVERVAELDFAGERIVRFAPGHEPADPVELSALPFENVLDHVLVRVTLDDVELRLMLDTGSPDLLHVGAEGQPGDVEVTGQDVEGNTFTMYFGTGSLEMAGQAGRTVPVLRAPEFPYFEETVEALGGDIQGLLGISSYAGRRLVFRPEEGYIRLGPAR